MSISTIIWFLFVFCIIVVSHEFGHMIIAKINGIHVEEFTIGLGPKLIGFTKKGTYYVLRWLPLGGACIFDSEELTIDKNKENSEELPDEEENKDITKEKHGIKFREANVWARIATVLAGPIFNFIVAYIMAIFIVWFCGTDIATVNGFTDDPVETEDGTEYVPLHSAIREAGVRVGDIIVKIDNTRIYTASEIYMNTYVNKSGKPMKVTYLRDGKKYTVTVNPVYDEEEDRYLLGLRGYGTTIACRNLSVFKYALYEVRYGLVATVKSIGMLVSGNGSKDDVAGPVGMAQIVGTVEENAKPYGFGIVLLNMINIAMLLSANLGIMNLLPIPALDGGRFLFLVIELVRGKPVPPEKEGIVNLIGFALLFCIMIFVMYNDIMRLIG